MRRSDAASTWHIVSGEYPPDLGGVADYCATVAQALADAGDRVHVWTSGYEGTVPGQPSVHRVLGSFTPDDLSRAGRLLDAHGEDGRLLVQWVPHGFGARGVNLRFPLWLHSRSVRRPQAIDVMVHEPFLPFAGAARHRAAAAAQRLMTATVLRAATRAFAVTPAWIELCRPFAGSVPFVCTPVPSGVPPAASSGMRSTVRRRLLVDDDQWLIGSFGRGGVFQENVLIEVARAMVDRGVRARLALVGLGSDAVVARIAGQHPELIRTIVASGPMAHADLSAALSACDVMIQPYADGICTRHSSVTALLAHGRPIVTNQGRFTEPFWRHSGAVRLVATPDAFAPAALDLLDAACERDRLSEAAAALYDARFHVRHTVAALRD